MACVTLSVLDLVSGAGVCECILGLFFRRVGRIWVKEWEVGRIRAKELVSRIFFGLVVGSIVAAMRARGVSSSASPSSGEARGCESWQWCDPADDE